MKLTARQAPRRGGRSAVIAHPFGALGEPAFCQAVGVGVADETPCAAPLPRESPSGAQSMWSHCPFPGLIGTITPALRGGTSRAAPHTFGALIAV